jgi:hypothetical protein
LTYASPTTSNNEINYTSLRRPAMADQILARVQNVSASDSYRVNVYDLFGGGTREVDGSPFNLNATDPPSPPFAVFVDATGNGMIRCLDPNGQQLCPDAPLPNNNNNIVTFPP